MIRSMLFTVAVVASGVLAAVPGHAEGQVERTGSRLGSDTTQRTVVQFSAPSEVKRVLRLLELGDTREAVETARDYLASLDSTISAGGAPLALKRYFALNTLCAALTKDGGIDEAIETCTRAVELFPKRWTAINTRATAYYASRRFENALADYRRALEVAPHEDDVVETIEHNIELAEQRLANGAPRF